jgi:hypothetical protein
VTSVHRSLLLWFAGAAVFGLLLLLLITGPGFSVVGNPDTTREPFDVRFADSVTFVVAPQDRGVANGVDALVLAIFAGIAFVTGLFFRNFVQTDLPRLQTFFAVVAGGAAVMALDEEFEMVETLAYNLERVVALPGSPQDFDEIFWAVLMAGFLWYFREVLLSSRIVAALWGLGAVIFFAGAIADVGFNAWFEDGLETIASCLFMAGFIALSFDRLVGTLVEDFLDPTGGVTAISEEERRPPQHSRLRERAG